MLARPSSGDPSIAAYFAMPPSLATRTETKLIACLRPRPRRSRSARPAVPQRSGVTHRGGRRDRAAHHRRREQRWLPESLLLRLPILETPPHDAARLPIARHAGHRLTGGLPVAGEGSRGGCGFRPAQLASSSAAIRLAGGDS